MVVVLSISKSDNLRLFISETKVLYHNNTLIIFMSQSILFALKSKNKNFYFFHVIALVNYRISITII